MKKNIKKNGGLNLRAPTKTLPITGVPIAGIRKYAELPSRASAERDLISFIDSCMTAEKVYGCIIKAWWGEGKTDAYENFIKLELGKRKVLTYDVTATTIAKILEKRQKDGISDPVIWRALLAALFESIWEERKSQFEEVKFLQPYEKENDYEYIQRVIQELNKKTERTFIFIDELEQLEIRPIRDDILLGIRGLFDQREENICGKLHLIMACTPDAFNRLIGSSTQMGGLLERLTIIELPRPEESDAIKFVYGLIDYVYEGKVPEPHPFINSGPAYAIMYAGHRSPRSMIKALQQVIEYAKQSSNIAGNIRQIDGWLIIEALKNFNLPIFGTQVLALDGDVLDRILRLLDIRGETERTEQIKKLVQLLIGEPIPHSIEELSLRVGTTETKVKDLISIANNRISESGLLSGLLVLPLSESSTPLESISEELKTYFMSFIFHEKNDFIIRNFLPTKYQALMSIFPEYNINAAQRIIRQILSYSTDTEFYVISPKLIHIIYPNPDFIELDFIVDRNKRLELWKEAYEKINEKEALFQIENSLLNLLKNLKIMVEWYDRPS
jgi:hypothetical protein